MALKVYMFGLIYFDGCDQPQMTAYVPDGRQSQFTDVPHNASLWIQADRVQDATQWGPAADRPARSVDGTAFIEFRITSPAEIAFPDGGNPLACSALDAAMPKLKEKKKDEDEEPFEIDPDDAETIAKVTINGGTLVPYELTNKNRSGIVQWTIASPSGTVITAGGGRSITLQPGDTEVVLVNIHEIPLTAKKDKLANDDHIQLFRQLMDSDLRANVTLIPDKPVNLDEVVTGNKYVGFLRMVDADCGVTPPCCAKFVRHS